MPLPPIGSFMGSSVQQPANPVGAYNPFGYPTTARTLGVPSGPSPDITSITNLVNTLNQNAQHAANAGRIPGEQNLENISSGNIESELQGQLPPDVIRLLNQQAAERGVDTGSPGSDNSNAAYLRALGLTSLDLNQRGQENLTRATARNPAAPIYDPSPLITTPYQAASLNLAAANSAADRQYNYDKMLGTVYGAANPYTSVNSTWHSDPANPGNLHFRNG